MSEDIKQILDMVKEGHISVEEGEKLINSIGEVKDVGTVITDKFLKVEVQSFDEDEAKVKVNLPLNIAKTVLKLGFIQSKIESHAGDGVSIDMDEINRLIDIDYTGDIVNVDAKEAKVRVWIE